MGKLFQLRLIIIILFSIGILFIFQGSLVSKQVRVIKITSYSNKAGQTDGDPNTAAFNNPVHPLMVASSRDLLKNKFVRNTSLVRITYLYCNGIPGKKGSRKESRGYHG